MRRLFCSLILLPVIVIGLCAQEVDLDTVRVCTYRIDRFDSASYDRVGDLRAIIDAIDPQILCIQDFTSYDAFRLFRDSVMKMMSHPLLGNAVFPVMAEYDQESISAIFYDRSLFQSAQTLIAFDSTRALLRFDFTTPKATQCWS